MNLSRRLLTAALLPTILAGTLHAQLAAPQWVEMIDHGKIEPRMAGIETPRGIKAEIIADMALAAAPRQVLFGDGGTLQILRDGSAGQLIVLSDANADGRLDRADTVLSDLGPAAAVLYYDGWYYVAAGGQVVRRRPHTAELFRELQAIAETKQGPPTAASPDKKWIEQVLLRGLNDKPADQTGGLTAGLDGWLYRSIGGDANRAASWDGSQATVLGSGAIFRFQPDGSRVHEFARGFAGPAGPPACDALGVLFQADRTPAGARLIHVREGGDYGWRSDLDPPKLDRPGTLPAMLRAAANEPRGTLVYHGAAFPKFFQRLLLVPESDKHAVRAYVLEADGATLAAKAEFELMRSTDRSFRPTGIVRAPDGAILVADASPRLWRLTWSGTADVPAITPPAAAPPAAEPTTKDLLAAALDDTRPAVDRAAALAAACRAWDATVLDACLSLLGQKDGDMQRLAADFLGDHLPDDAMAQERMAGIMQQHLLSASLPARRSLYIALGKLGTKLETVPEWIFEASSVTPDVQTNRDLFDGHVRAAEMPKGWATELLLGNLEVALFDPNPEPDERQRLKKFVVATAEAMRTRELADFLERVIRDEKDYFSKLDGPLQVRLLGAWNNVLVEPPIRADAVAEWLEKHPAASTEVQQAAWQTLAHVGTAKPDVISQLARQLLETKVDPRLKPNVVKALARHVVAGKPGEVDALLAEFKKR